MVTNTYLLKSETLSNNRLQWVASMCKLTGSKFRYDVFKVNGPFQGVLINDRMMDIQHIRRVFFMFDVEVTNQYHEWNAEING